MINFVITLSKFTAEPLWPCYDAIYHQQEDRRIKIWRQFVKSHNSRSDEPAISVFKWKLTWNLRVRVWFFLESHSLLFKWKKTPFCLRLCECCNIQRVSLLSVAVPRWIPRLGNQSGCENSPSYAPLYWTSLFGPHWEILASCAYFFGCLWTKPQQQQQQLHQYFYIIFIWYIWGCWNLSYRLNFRQFDSYQSSQSLNCKSFSANS